MRIDTKPLGTEYKVWIPVEIENEKIDDLVGELIGYCGGLTDTIGTGVWVSHGDGEHHIVTEDVHILQVVTDLDIRGYIMDIVELLLTECRQEAVMVAYGTEIVLHTAIVEEANQHIKFEWRK